MGGLILAKGDQFWLPKSVRPDQFWQQKWSGGTSFSAKIGPAGPILGGTDFGVTDQHERCLHTKFEADWANRVSSCSLLLKFNNENFMKLNCHLEGFPIGNVQQTCPSISDFLGQTPKLTTHKY